MNSAADASIEALQASKVASVHDKKTASLINLNSDQVSMSEEGSSVVLLSPDKKGLGGEITKLRI